MKNIYILLLGVLILFPTKIYSQSGFKYQAVIRDNTGKTLNNKNISVLFSIYRNSPDGNPIYQEEHTTTTNSNGSLSLEIGNGTPKINKFASIDWSQGSYFVQTAVDQGAGYNTTGIQELVSVPYAEYAEQTGTLQSTSTKGKTYQLTVDDLGNLQTVEMPKGYTKLVFQDEFNGIGLPDPNKWGYEIGFVRNNELQYYTDKRIENIFQKDGLLNFRCINNDTIKDAQGKILNSRIIDKDGKILTEMKEGAKKYYISSASITTKKKGDWTYCRVEARIKIALGSGTWPAVWMMPTDSEYDWWPRSGEIDIMEYVGNEKDVYHCALHYLNGDKGNRKTLTNVADWHVVALEWHEDRLEWYIDGKLYYRVKNPNTDWGDWPFDKRFHLILNFAFGGNWGGVNNTRFDTSILPQIYQIDYVRIFQ